MVEEPLVPKPKKPRSSIKIRRESIDTLVEVMSGEKLEEVKNHNLSRTFTTSSTWENPSVNSLW